jgi:hypothetical protein
MLRVYVAGAYSSPNYIDVLNNMRKGMRAATEILLAGFAPFTPWLDYHYQLQLREGEFLNVTNYYEYSLAWLDVSDIMFVLDGWENSQGTITEIQRANKLNIPIIYGNMDALLRQAENMRLIQTTIR